MYELVVTLYFPVGDPKTYHVYGATHVTLALALAELVTSFEDVAYVINNLD